MTMIHGKILLQTIAHLIYKGNPDYLSSKLAFFSNRFKVQITNRPQLCDDLFLILLYQKWSNNQTVIGNLFEHELLQNKMKINVVSWTMAAQWSWDVKEGDDVCGICHSEYDGCCPTCKRPGDDCPLIWGECSHVFHLHCIMAWFQSSTRGETCPMDRTPWQTAKAALQ